MYGGSRAVSSTTLIVVLLLYFALWAAFSLGMRYGVASYTVESTLPIHTPTPAPPILLHSPTGRNAVPAAPAIKISSAHHSTATGADQDDEQDDEYQLKHQHRTQPPSPTAPPSSPVNFGPPSPRINGVAFAGGGGVKFQTRPRGMTGDSTNSEIYPTYATYRQQQHANFDAFAQRIRKALETANSQHRLEQEELMEQQRREEEEQIRLQNLSETDDGSGGGRQPLPAISATHTRQILEADGSTISSAGAGPSQTLSFSTNKGRPRSSSAASMISNLSEKIRLGSGFFVKSSGVGGTTGGRPRAGSDASVLAAPPPPPQNQPQQHNHQGTLSTSFLSDPVTSSTSGSPEKSSTTTMAALASATAVASAIFMPRESVYSQAEEGTGSGKTRSRRQSRAMAHPLAETANIDDEKQGSSEEEEKKAGHAEKSYVVDFLDVKYTEPEEIVISDHERSLSDDIHVLVSKPTIISTVSATRLLSQVPSVAVDVKPDGVS
ncbi:MAG: hypothetical protein BYD32DRAFT_438793 [Podila humilis]|nr:MAG: hypothetical protein BYD32DRAFT_438793 [Podila humilis]